MELSDWWPLFSVVIRTQRLELRLPNEDELPSLAAVAAAGIHGPDERPFLTPWEETTPEERGRRVLRSHWGALGRWSVDHWALGLAMFVDGSIVGEVTLRARDFPVTREVATSSWLGVAHQGRGLGTEARLGVLTLAFDHLNAAYAVSEAFLDNHASLGVSRKLGYQPDGISRDVRDGEVVVSQRLRLTRQRWEQVDRSPVSVTGVPHEFFGAV